MKTKGAHAKTRHDFVLETVYRDAGVTRLRAHPAKDRPVLDEDVARLSPLGHEHSNTLGRYSFTASQPRDSLRPLRPHDGCPRTA